MTTLLGLIAGFVLLIVAMTMGGSPLSFLDGPAILIVFGGTLAVTVISFSLEELRQAPRTLWSMLRNSAADPRKAAATMIKLSERARKDGLFGLEQISKAMSDDLFLHRAMRLTADGTTADEIEKILKTETYAASASQMTAINILRRAADVAPAMGLIGTLVGLVQMLGSLDDPSSIGPAMAVALLTTFYGAMLAHMLFLPLAARAERIARDEALLQSVYTIGAAAIGRKDNPRRIETLINTILPPQKRIQYYS
ncbi:motility protein A [Govanella unica]|uniref:MotA/TolQ/ExbB proton channel family protein n=1 Tax=Govanella unica TaxID=2975056 RepID=A0A9X3TX54_9PROT|nr:MotA/TolQ/ExbB proton channel family protein [Govania unica]MDA5193012.1 MotA/TolQ/ExbB proton channel family protein [Govania unica]